MSDSDPSRIGILEATTNLHGAALNRISLPEKETQQTIGANSSQKRGRTLYRSQSNAENENVSAEFKPANTAATTAVHNKVIKSSPSMLLGSNNQGKESPKATETMKTMIDFVDNKSSVKSQQQQQQQQTQRHLSESKSVSALQERSMNAAIGSYLNLTSAVKYTSQFSSEEQVNCLKEEENLNAGLSESLVKLSPLEDEHSQMKEEMIMVPTVIGIEDYKITHEKEEYSDNQEESKSLLDKEKQEEKDQTISVKDSVSYGEKEVQDQQIVAQYSLGEEGSNKVVTEVTIVPGDILVKDQQSQLSAGLENGATSNPCNTMEAPNSESDKPQAIQSTSPISIPQQIGIHPQNSNPNFVENQPQEQNLDEQSNKSSYPMLLAPQTPKETPLKCGIPQKTVDDEATKTMRTPSTGKNSSYLFALPPNAEITMRMTETQIIQQGDYYYGEGLNIAASNNTEIHKAQETERQEKDNCNLEDRQKQVESLGELAEDLKECERKEDIVVNQIEKSLESAEGVIQESKGDIEQVLSTAAAVASDIQTDQEFLNGIDTLIQEIQQQLSCEQVEESSAISNLQQKRDVISNRITNEEEYEQELQRILQEVEAVQEYETIETQKEKELAKMRETEASMEYLLECMKIIREAEGDLDALQKCMQKEQSTLREIQALSVKQDRKAKEDKEKQVQSKQQAQQNRANNNDGRQQQQNASKSNNQQQHQPNGNVRDILTVSLENIRFGVVFPGNIFEDAVEIANRSNDTVFLKAVGLCLNPEFDSHGEYVYSIRKTTNYDYNEKLTIQMSPQSTVKLHVALKVPNIHAATILKGSFAVTIAGYDTYISIPITAQVEIPKIVCTRQLFHSSSDCKVIRLAVRKSKKSDCKIPFKNVSNHPLQIEPAWLDDQQMIQLVSMSSGIVSKTKQPSPFNLVLQPALFTVPPKGLFMMQCVLKPSNAYKEFTEKRAQENDKSALLLKNVLLLKIVNSSILLHFPLSLEITL